MGMLVVKLVALLAWAGALQALARRVGPHRAGLLLGLPSTTAVAVIACGVESGPDAAATMAGAGLLGLIPAAALPMALAGALARGWRLPRALSVALAAYAALAVPLGLLPELTDASRLMVAVAGLLTLAHGTRIEPGGPNPTDRRPRPDAGRARGLLIPGACLLMVTAVRDAAGASWAGLLAPFPGVTLALLVSTYTHHGPRAAGRLAVAVPRGCLGTLAFLAVFAVAGRTLGPLAAAGAGYAAALGVLAGVGGTVAPAPWRGLALPRPLPRALRPDPATRPHPHPRGRLTPRRPPGVFAPQFDFLEA
jgi:hypothetical protein